MQYLLQPDIVRLPQDIISIYIQAAIKVFGFWASELAQRWDEDDLPGVKTAVERISDRMGTLVTSPHIEVQERVRPDRNPSIYLTNIIKKAANVRQLCNFIIADLNNHHPKFLTPAYPAAGSSGSLDETPISEDISFPKSLFLIYPLFSTYELNPVASHAQASVPVPAGLDLDAWVVPPPQEPVAPTEETSEKKKKSKKGKETGNGKKSKASSKKKLKQVELLQDGDVLTPVDPDVETPEERERASVYLYFSSHHRTN